MRKASNLSSLSFSWNWTPKLNRYLAVQKTLTLPKCCSKKALISPYLRGDRISDCRKNDFVVL